MDTVTLFILSQIQIIKQDSNLRIHFQRKIQNFSISQFQKFWKYDDQILSQFLEEANIQQQSTAMEESFLLIMNQLKNHQHHQSQLFFFQMVNERLKLRVVTFAFMRWVRMVESSNQQHQQNLISPKYLNWKKKKIIDISWTNDNVFAISKLESFFDEVVYQLKTNREFINERIKEEEYKSYIKFFDQSTSNNLFFNDFIKSENKTFRKVQIDFAKMRNSFQKNFLLY